MKIPAAQSYYTSTTLVGITFYAVLLQISCLTFFFLCSLLYSKYKTPGGVLEEEEEAKYSLKFSRHLE